MSYITISYSFNFRSQLHNTANELHFTSVTRIWFSEKTIQSPASTKSNHRSKSPLFSPRHIVYKREENQFNAPNTTTTTTFRISSQSGAVSWMSSSRSLVLNSPSNQHSKPNPPPNRFSRHFTSSNATKLPVCAGTGSRVLFLTHSLSVCVSGTVVREVRVFLDFDFDCCFCRNGDMVAEDKQTLHRRVSLGLEMEILKILRIRLKAGALISEM